MNRDRIREGIADQFSYRGEQSDIWRVFDRFLETDAFLNLGYSEWYESHLVGSPQRRLASLIGRRLEEHLPRTAGVELLDVGCGRGGPAIYLAEKVGFQVTGLDLVPYNVSRARENAAGRDSHVEFVAGDALQPPIASGAVQACTAVDALVYLPNRQTVIETLADVLAPGGVVVLSDLVTTRTDDPEGEKTIMEFAETWDMPRPGTVPAYERSLVEAGFEVESIEILTPNSIGRFRKWTSLFESIYDTPVGRLVDRGLHRYGLEPETIARQIRRAHEALPALEHVLIVGRLQEEG